MSTIAQVFVILGGVGGLFTLQSFWLVRYLDAHFAAIDARFEQVDRRFAQVDARFDQVDRRFEQIEARLDRVETALMRDYGERIARLEAKLDA